MSFELEPEIVTLAWIDSASVQFPLNIYPTQRDYSSLITVYRLPCGCARRSARRADGQLCCGLFFRIGTRESNLRGVCDPSFHFLVALIQPSASNSLMISNSFGS